MMRYFIVLAGLLCVSIGQASPNDFIQKAKQLDLAKDPVWLKLLHHHSTSMQLDSDIITDGFLFAPDGSPEDELSQTLAAFSRPWSDDPNAHPVCRFPARYFWLSQHVELDPNALNRCQRLNDWARFGRLRSISVILSSGYISNPASTFGHTLIKLNNSPYDNTGLLVDQGINFGARVPDGELGLIYAMRGFFGGYKAGFMDKQYFFQDYMYSRVENRDYWEYELNLNNDQQRLMIYHLWELLEKKYDYYFLKQNCGYRVAEIIDLVTEEELVHESMPWYLPVELFHELEQPQNRHLIRDIHYLPASYTTLMHQFSELTPTEQQQFRVIVEDHSALRNNMVQNTEIESRIRVLDVLLSYLQYKNTDENSELNDSEERLKQQVLLLRLNLPATPDTAFPEIPSLPSPTKNSPPTSVNLSASPNGTDIGITMVNYGLLGQTQAQLAQAELITGDLQLRIHDGKSFVQSLRFASAHQYDTQSTNVQGSRGLSWRSTAGISRETPDCAHCYALDASFGAGYAENITAKGFAYALIEPDIINDTIYLKLPVLGVRYRPDEAWALWYEYAAVHENDGLYNDHQLGIRYALNREHEVRLEHDNNDDWRLSYYRFW